MADADIGVQTAMGNAQQAMDISGVEKNSSEGLQLGMSLASRQADFEKKKQDLQFQQQQHDMQKHEWMHGILSDAVSENDPKIKSMLLDNLNDQFPKIFDGKRMSPTMLEAMNKSPDFMQKMGAVIRIRKAAMNGKPELIPDLDKEVLNEMTNPDFTSTLQKVNQMHSGEDGIIKALTSQGVATPQAAAATGQSQDEMQANLNNSPKYVMRKGMLAARLDDQASKVGDSYEKNTKLSTTYTATQKAGRDLSMMNDTTNPLTPQNLSEMEMTIPQLLGGAGASSLGGVERVEMETAQRKLADFQQKYSGKPVDMRQKDPELVNQIQHTIQRLKGANEQAMEQIAGGIHNQFQQSGNEKVHAVNKAKLLQYAPDTYSKIYGAQSPQANINPATGEPAQPKITDDMVSGLRSQAMQAIQKVKAAPQGTVSVTEDQIKQKFKSMTGHDL